MAKIICTLPNASELISGVRFVSHAEGMISETVGDDVADAFLGIPGYKLSGQAADVAGEKSTGRKPKKSADAETETQPPADDAGGQQPAADAAGEKE